MSKDSKSEGELKMTKCVFVQPDGRNDRVVKIGTIIVFSDGTTVTVTGISVTVDLVFSPLMRFDVEGSHLAKDRYMLLKDFVNEIKMSET